MVSTAWARRGKPSCKAKILIYIIVKACCKFRNLGIKKILHSNFCDLISK